jgi:hypothetical protein
LIPAGSRLLELPEVQTLIGPFDEAALCYWWAHPDPRVDQLYADVLAAVHAGQADDAPRQEVFARVWALAHAALGVAAPALPVSYDERPRAPVPRLSEPWFC